MKAKKCDFCGVLYEEKILSIAEEIRDAAISVWPFYTNRDLLNKISMLVDICPECSSTLIETINKLRGKKK